jgi:methyl-accepting chemotaxis protein
MKPNNYKGGSMKRTLMMTLAVLLNCAVLCLPANAQTGKEENPSAQDLLVRNEVETAVSMLQAIFAKQQQGEMTPEQAKKLGADLLRELRYGTDGYFWADTTEGVNVVLYGRKDVEGRKRIEDKDLKGTFYVKEFLAKGKDGGGYVEYWFPKKGQTEPQPKRSYVLLFKPFGWVVGSGYYR